MDPMDEDEAVGEGRDLRRFNNSSLKSSRQRQGQFRHRAQDEDIQMEDDDLSMSSGAQSFRLSDDGYPSTDDEDGDASDQDQEFYTLQEDVANFQQKLKQKGRNDTASPDRPSRAGFGNRGGKGVARGPRKAAEPPLEIKILLAQANGAFVNGEYEKAEELCNQVLMLNDETYAAHALLSGIYLEQGEVRLGIIAYLSAAHLRPKDPSLWRSCVQLILEHGRDRRAEYLTDAIYCYTQLVRINGKDFEARYERALLVRELGLQSRAVHELHQIQKLLPHDTTALRLLSEIYIDTKQVDKAIDLYQKYIKDELSVDRQSAGGFNWSDINVYVELFGIQQRYAEGLDELSSLSRWLLGREEETCFRDFEGDDREWDAEEYPRRLEVPAYTANRYGQDTYGAGLPLELRVKLGIFRLKLGDFEEASSHFDWLEPENDAASSKLFDYPDLFRETADALQTSGHHNEALSYYEPLQQVDTYSDLQLYFHMATSYRAVDLYDRAEQCYRLVLENDEHNIEARAELARMFEGLGRSEDAFAYANEVLDLTRQDRGQRSADDAIEMETDAFVLPSRQTAARRTLAGQKQATLTAEQRQSREERAAETARVQHVRLQVIAELMRAGDKIALEEWMATATSLISQFRNKRVFYPWLKYYEFRGYNTEARCRARSQRSKEQEGVAGDMEAMASRLEMQAFEEQAVAEGIDKDEDLPVPSDFLGISFSEWLDIFCECAVEYAKKGEATEAYDVINGAKDANVFYHDGHYTLQLHICWLACAIILRDVPTISNLTRWFMKNHQYTTDSYRLFSTVCLIPLITSTETYSSGHVQKFILRQVKTMDHTIKNPPERPNPFFKEPPKGERAQLAAKDLATGEVVIPRDIDPVLLMLYAQMLYVGSTYTGALTYIWRAHAAITEGGGEADASVYLCLGLSYAQYALKRQSGNRHLLIAQGLSYMFKYYDLRLGKQTGGEPSIEAKMEAEYNIGRVFHMIGLTHLAIPYYERVLELRREGEGETKIVEDYALEASYNLQSLYFHTGNMDMAQKVTEEGLVL